MGRTYMPYQDAQFDEWLQNHAARLPAIATLLSVDPMLVAAVTSGYASWDTAYDAHIAQRNAAQAATEVKDEAKVSVQIAVRLVVGVLQKHPGLTDPQRETLGITVPDRIPTPTSPDYVVNLAPPILLIESRRGQVVIHFGVNPSDERNNAKPPEIAGAKIWYRIETGPWEFVADDTNSPYTHNFNITEPQSVEYRAQWFDKKMRTGPFSESAKCAVSP